MVQASSSSNGQFVSANGLNMYYEESGSGELLVFLHGGMAAGTTVGHLIPAFSKQFKVLTPDLRGHGKTDNPSGELSYRLMAEDMADFIQALNLSQPLICGWSDGGQIALELGMHYPDLMRCMVVGAAWYQFSQQYQDMLKAIGFEAPGVANLEKMKQALPQMVELWRGLHASIHGPDYWETLATQISTMWWTPLGYTAHDFQQIKAPTLILIGDRDPIIPVEEAVEMYRLIPGAELAIISNSDHSLPRTRAEMFSASVLDFLVRHK